MSGLLPSRNLEPAPYTPNPTGGQPTPPSPSGGFPPQKVNKYVQAEVPTGILTPPPPPLLNPPPLRRWSPCLRFVLRSDHLQPLSSAAVGKLEGGYMHWHRYYDNAGQWREDLKEPYEAPYIPLADGIHPDTRPEEEYVATWKPSELKDEHEVPPPDPAVNKDYIAWLDWRTAVGMRSRFAVLVGGSW